MTEELPVYTVRYSVQASQDILNEVYRLTEITDDLPNALAWSKALDSETGTLATLPRRLPVRPRETRLFGWETRCLIFRRTTSVTAYHVFYTIDEDGPDGRLVRILHVRHASRKPLSRAEAGEILTNL